MKRYTFYNNGQSLHLPLSLCYAALFVSLSMSCSHKDDEEIKMCVERFAQDYFNMRYPQAELSCTPQAIKWVRQKASNVRLSDLEVLNNQTDTATCLIDDILTTADTATVTITACNFMECNNIGQPGVMRSSAKFTIQVIKKNGKWAVDINRPLSGI